MLLRLTFCVLLSRLQDYGHYGGRLYFLRVTRGREYLGEADGDGIRRTRDTNGETKAFFHHILTTDWLLFLLLLSSPTPLPSAAILPSSMHVIAPSFLSSSSSSAAVWRVMTMADHDLALSGANSPPFGKPRD
jgi:hypothetical protein